MIEEDFYPYASEEGTFEHYILKRVQEIEKKDIEER